MALTRRFGSKTHSMKTVPANAKTFLTVCLLVCIVPTLACRQKTESNLILITLDTFRPDHLGVEGYARAHTPNLDNFARSGSMFTHCVVPVPITLPSHTSILTGRSLLSHGVHDNAGYTVADANLTLAEILQARGYQTAAFVSGAPLLRVNGLNQGFDIYDDHLGVTTGLWWNESQNGGKQLQMDERKADETTAATIAWLKEKGQTPFFAWVHYFDAHQGYTPPPPYDDLFYDNPYDGEIAFIDEQIGRLLGVLDDLGLRDSTSIIITGDHGEGLLEHNELTHAMLTYDSTLRVPLLAQLVGFDDHGVHEDHVSVLDIVPTVLDLLGVSQEFSFDGRSLLPFLRGETLKPLPTYFETEGGSNAFGWALIEGAREGRWKYIHSVRDELYDIETDPGETENLILNRPEVAENLRNTLIRLKNKAESNKVSPGESSAEISDDVRRQLAALGYLATNVLDDKELASERAQTHPADRISIINDWSQARSAVFADNYDFAEDLLNTLLAYDPKNIDFLDLKSYLLLRTDRLEEARGILEKLIELQPENPRVMFSLAFIYSKEDKIEQALELLKLSKSVDPNAQAKYLNAEYVLHQKMGDLDAAIENLTLLAELEPSYSEPCRILASLWRKKGQLEKCEHWLKEAIRRNPFDPRAHQNLAATFIDTGRLEEGMRMAERCVRLWPDYPQGLYTLAQARASTGDLDGAAELLRDLVALYPESNTGILAARALESIAAANQS